MPGNQVKDWKVYHECMEGKEPTDDNKGYCARVANAVAKKHKEALSLTSEEISDLVKYAIEKGLS